MIKMVMTFKDADEALKTLQKLSTPTMTPMPPIPSGVDQMPLEESPATSPVVSQEASTEAAPKKKRGRKSAAERNADVEAKAAAYAEQVGEIKGGNGETKYTKEDALAALEKLNTVKGLAVAKEALKRFDAKRLSDLPERDYGNFIIQCDYFLAQ